ncbi:multidrug effflux MFS transporter [Aestuariimicrobium ganziense]|uniref:multidrug effflux MFS transporter n=1 Tax=Aestuariimicrobium ganziense TaxID=2773677 RepID=UPI001944E877|nr:multidrug effflux MFS transporter [Aestuariimicrobium ganziense]
MRHHFGVTLVIAMLGMLGPFTVDTIFPGFAAVGEQFRVDEVAMQQVTSVYLLSFAAMSLLHGPISDAVGRRPVMITGLVLYALASIGCALSPNLGALLAFRSMQGLAAGAAQIISRTLIRDMFAGPAAQRLMAQVSMIFAVAPAVAPIVGGWLLQLGRWPVIFWFLTGFALFLAVLVLLVVPETHPVENRVPFNLREVIGGVFEVGRHGAFQRLALTSTFAFAAQFLYIVGAPIFIVRLLGKGEQDFWMLFVPLMASMIVGSFLNARLAHRVPGRKLATIGFGLTLVAGVVNVVASSLPGAPALPWAVLGPSLVAFGVALSFPVVQLVMLDLFPRRRGAAASMQAFVTLLFNAALAGVISPLVSGTVLQMAMASAGFSVIGFLLWLWHLRAVPADREVVDDHSPASNR